MPAALAAAFLAVVTWSSAFVGIEIALVEMSPSELVFLRFCVASMLFLALVPFGAIRRPARWDLPALLILGAVGHAIYQVLLALAQTGITAGVTGVIIAGVPLLSALIALPLLGERFGARGWTGTVVGVCGVAAVGLSGGNPGTLNPWVLVGVLAATCSAIFFVGQKRLVQSYGALTLTAIGVWLTALTQAPVVVLTEGLPEVTVCGALTVVYLGIVPTAVGYTLWSWALARAPATKVTGMLYLQPVVTFALAYAALGEVPDAFGLAGGALTLAGVILVATDRPIRRARAPEGRRTFR